MFEKYVERQQEGIALRKKARCHASSEKFKTNEQPTQFYLGKWGKFRLLIYNSSELAWWKSKILGGGKDSAANNIATALYQKLTISRKVIFWVDTIYRGQFDHLILDLTVQLCIIKASTVEGDKNNGNFSTKIHHGNYVVQVSAENLPDSKPRYLMGVGHQVRCLSQRFRIVSSRDRFFKGP